MDELHGPPFEVQPAAQVYRDLGDARKRIAALEAELLHARTERDEISALLEKHYSDGYKKGVADAAAQLELARTALVATRTRICATASVILMPGTITLDDACVSASVITDAQKAMKIINDALAQLTPTAAPEEHDRAVRTDHEYFDHPFYSGPGCSICGLSVLHHQSEELDEHDRAVRQETAKRCLELCRSFGPFSLPSEIRCEFGLEAK